MRFRGSQEAIRLRRIPDFARSEASGLPSVRVPRPSRPSRPRTLQSLMPALLHSPMTRVPRLRDEGRVAAHDGAGLCR